MQIISKVHFYKIENKIIRLRSASAHRRGGDVIESLLKTAL